MVCLGPDPPREAIDENLSRVDAGQTITMNSDSEEEENNTDGYELLSMGNDIPATDSDSDYSDSGDESTHETQSNIIPTSNDLPVPSNDEASSSQDLKEVWSSPREHEGIVMGTEQVDQVKAAMASFSLPPSAIPPWAASVPEDQWKEQLMDRLKSLQGDKA